MSENQPGDRLDSWKEIAAHLRRDESTVRRWEKAGLPVHRHRHKSRAAVFAYRSELDAWWQHGGTGATPTADEPAPTSAQSVEGTVAKPRFRSLLWPGAVAAFVLLALAGGRVAYLAGSSSSSRAPVLTPLVSVEGDVGYPAFAPDGHQLAFTLSTPEASHTSVYLTTIGGGSPMRLTYPSDGGDFAPKWSPDGKQVAFVRTSDTEAGILMVPSTGGPERQLVSLRPDRYFDLDWSADGNSLAFAERASERDPYAIFLLNVADGTRRQVRRPPPESFGEVRFSLSPDSRALAFLRHERESSVISLQVMALADASSLRTVASYREWVGSVTWSADGQSLILAGNSGGVRKLWRVFLNNGREEELAGIGTDEYYPAVSRRGDRLAFVRDVEDADLWRSDLTGPDGTGRMPVRLINSKRIEGAPRFSPDGTRLAFQSYRSGVPEIWTSNPDGSDAVQVTNLRTSKPELPAWSPDGRMIAFADGAFHVISAAGGQPRRLFTDADPFDGPSWSHDGRIIYFWRTHLGEDPQIWRVPSTGGVEEQVTHHGGLSSMESPDGQFLYFTKLSRQGIWKMRAAGGPETLVVPDMPPDFPGYWALVTDGIYYLDASAPDTPKIAFFTFATRASRTIVALNGQPVNWSGGLTVSPDHKSLVFSLRQYSSFELILADNVR